MDTPTAILHICDMARAFRGFGSDRLSILNASDGKGTKPTAVTDQQADIVARLKPTRQELVVDGEDTDIDIPLTGNSQFGEREDR